MRPSAATVVSAARNGCSGPVRRAASPCRATVPIVALATATLVLHACGETNGHCSSDSDCALSDACDVASGRCAPRARVNLALEVLPRTRGTGVPQEFVDPPLSSQGSVLLQLQAPVALQGKVVASNARTTGIAARVIAWRRSLIRGRPAVRFETQTGASPGTELGHYALWLSKGFKYSLYAAPLAKLAETVPPLLETGLLVDSHLQRNLVLDGPDRSVLVRGRVVAADGTPYSFPLRVRAFTGSGTHRWSTVARTCSKGDTKPCTCDPAQQCYGQFSVRVPHGLRRYTLRVETGTDAPTKTSEIVPTLECHGANLGLVAIATSGGDPSKVAAHELGDPIRLPKVGLAEPFSIAVVARDDRTAVAGARVTFTTKIAAPRAPEAFAGKCEAEFERTVITDGKGKATVALLPAAKGKLRSYVVTVVSPSNSKQASRRIEHFSVPADAGDLKALELSERFALHGTVVDSAGTPLRNAAVDARPIGSAEGLELGPATAVTSDCSKLSTSQSECRSGSFVLYVDPGSYNFHIRPPAESGVPSFLVKAKQVKAGAERLLFKAPPAEILVGRVVDANNRPLSGYSVSAYDSAPTSLSSVEAVLRGAAFTDGEGRFRLLLGAR